MTLYLDEDLAPAIAERLRRRGIDAVSAHEVGMTGHSDSTQLDYAASAKRAIVTRNVRHFRVLGAARVRSQTPHSGIILCPDVTSLIRVRCHHRCSDPAYTSLP